MEVARRGAVTAGKAFKSSWTLSSPCEGNGGELVVRNAVTGIVVDERRVGGIKLAHDGEIRAPFVRQTFERLVALEQFPDAYLRKYNLTT